VDIDPWVVGVGVGYKFWAPPGNCRRCHPAAGGIRPLSQGRGFFFTLAGLTGRVD